ncbi:mitochondrial import inner membrane translocase subunit TIM23 [Sarotherodon galilaeus]
MPPSWEELRRAPNERSPSSHGAEARGGCSDVPAGSSGSQLCQRGPGLRPRGQRPEGTPPPGRGPAGPQAPTPTNRPPGVRVPLPPEGQTVPRPRRCNPSLWGGGKQTASLSAVAGRPRIPHPNPTASTSSQPPSPDG